MADSIGSFCIIDRTLPALCAEGGTSSELSAFSRGLLQTGVRRLEVSPRQFAALCGRLPKTRLLVRAAGPDEIAFCRGLGAVFFVVDGGVFSSLRADAAPDFLRRLTVEFAPEDAAFPPARQAASAELPAGLRTIAAETEKAGAVRLRGLETVLEGDYGQAFRTLRGLFGSRLCLDIGDGAGCSTAACYEWLRMGGGSACVSFAGVAGGAPLEELLAALSVLNGGRFELSDIPALRRHYESAAHARLSPFKAVSGTDIFAFESGIHADGIFKNPANYEPFAPESVGNRRKLVIGKHSGSAALRAKLRELGFSPDEALLRRLGPLVRACSMRQKRGLRDDELRRIYLGAAEGYGANPALPNRA